MAGEASELAHRVERLVESLDGVRGCRVDAGSGEIESIAVDAEPGGAPERMVGEIRGVVLVYLGRSVSADRIRVELPEGSGMSEPGYRRGREELSVPRRGFRAVEDESREMDSNGGEHPTPTPDEPEDAEDGEPGREPAARGSELREMSGAIELDEYRIVGGRGPGVEVQVSLTDRNGRSYEGSVSAENLATVRSESFIHATVRAARRLMEAGDGGQERASGTVVEVVGETDDVRVGDDRFFAVTLEAWNGGGRIRTTGFEAVGGKVGADVAVAATLDALRRLFRD